MASALGPLHKPRAVLETDHYHYIAMSRDPLGGEAAGTPPFCWRILTPLLAFALTRAGLGTNAAFWIVTNACLVGFLSCLYALLVGRGFAPRHAVPGVVLAGLVPGAVRWYEYQYWMTDPLCLFLIAAALVLIAARRDRELLLLSLLGVAARESYVLVFACLLASRLRRDGIASALQATARVALPSLALLAAIRLLVPASPGAPLLAVVGDVIGFRWRHLFDNQLYLATVGAFGVLLPMALAFPARFVAALRERPEDAVLLAGAYASLLVGTNTERLLAYALPAVATVALAGLVRIEEAARLPAGLAGGALVLVQVVFYLLTPFHGAEGLSLYQPASWTVVGLMTGTWIAARALARARA